MITHILLICRAMSRFFLTAAIAVLLGGFVYQPAAIHAEEKNNKQKLQPVTTTNVPDREVEYEDSLSPEWKKNWDLARELYRDEKHREALVQYEILLSQKENCDEARWEYVTLLILQERWQAAAEQLEKLLANEPDNLDYGFAMAKVHVHLGNLDAAVIDYRALTVASKTQQNKIKALRGLIRVLELAGNMDELIPVLEKLIALQPESLEPRLRLAQILVETGAQEKAREILTFLEQRVPENTEILKLLADSFGRSGNSEKEAAYRQKIISVDATDMESHAMLQKYYREKENWAMSLKHLEKLLAVNPNDIDLLEIAADLNLKLGRIDKALEFYNAILSVQPNNKAVQKKKREARQIVARDLVVLVENDGGQKLWQDLVNVTADRLGVYREIATILREKGNSEELIEVLTLICLEDPSDEESLAELTALMKEKGLDKDLHELQAELKKNKQQQ